MLSLGPRIETAVRLDLAFRHTFGKSLYTSVRADATIQRSGPLYMAFPRYFLEPTGFELVWGILREK